MVFFGVGLVSWFLGSAGSVFLVGGWAVSGFLVLGCELLLFLVASELALDSATFGLGLIVFGASLCVGP